MAEQDPPKILVRLADLILASGGAAFLLTLSYVLYYYAWTGERQFASSKGLLLYCVVPALIASALLWSLRWQASHKINLALCLVSVGASLYVSEAALNIWSDLPSVIIERSIQARVEAAKEIGVDFDERSKGQVVTDLRNEGIDAFPSIFPAALLGDEENGHRKSVITVGASETLPLAGIANKTIVVCNEDGKYLKYTSDDHGFNNPPNLWRPSQIDIAAVGDSYTQGWCVAPEKNFVDLLRGDHRAVLNLGIENNGPLVMLATIKEYAAVVQPKIVLWFYFEGNDLTDLRREETSPLLMSYLTGESKQDLFHRQAEIDQALMDYVQKVGVEENRALRKFKEISSVLRDVTGLPYRLEGIIKVSQIRGRLGLIQGLDGLGAAASAERTQASIEQRALSIRPDLDLFYSTLVEAQDTVNKWKGQLYFVYLPSWYRYVHGLEAQPDRDSILHEVQRAGVPLIDVHEAFALNKDPRGFFPFRLDGHYNEEGHRVVAELVRRELSIPPD